MAPHILVGRHVRTTIWDDLVELMPGAPIGLIMQASGQDDEAEVELRVQLPGFKSTFNFYLVDVELLPSDYTDKVFFTDTHPAQQTDTVHLYPSIEAAQFEVGSSAVIYRVAACLARGGQHLLPYGSFCPEFNAAWTRRA